MKQQYIKYNKIEKRYMALVHNHTKEREVLVDKLLKNEKTNTSYVDDAGKESKLEYNLIEYRGNKTLLDINLKTNTSKVVEKNTKNSKEAILDYEVLKYDEETNLSVLKIDLHTGRHHQIRVQLSHHGYPIYGDQKYGIDKPGIQIHLWAYKLKFKHPTKDEMMEFVCYPDFK